MEVRGVASYMTILIGGFPHLEGGLEKKGQMQILKWYAMPRKEKNKELKVVDFEDSENKIMKRREC